MEDFIWNWDETALKERCHSLVGPALSIMMESRENTERSLLDLDPIKRKVACILMLHHWRAKALLSSWCEQALANDPDSGVREIALVALGLIHAGTGDARMGRTFAQIVCDETQHRTIRFLAYRGLYRIRGLPFLTGEEQLRMLKQRQIGENADWKFVRSFLVEPG